LLGNSFEYTEFVVIQVNFQQLGHYSNYYTINIASQKVTSGMTSQLARPVTCMNPYQLLFFPYSITLWNISPLPAQNCQSLHSLDRLYFCQTFNTSANN